MVEVLRSKEYWPARNLQRTLAEPCDLSQPTNWGGTRLVWRIEPTDTGFALRGYRLAELGEVAA